MFCFSLRRENDEKLSNNISRAKSRVTELALCNDWEYFVTLTLSEDKQNRFDLQGYIKDLGNWIGNYNRKYGCHLRYIIIPEFHKDGAVHAHGLLCGVQDESLCKNEYGFMDLPYYRNRFGFISLGKIRDKEKVSRYITKYITKGFCDRAKGEHMFYASRGLMGAEKIHEGVCRSYELQFENDYCAIEWGTSAEELLRKVTEFNI